MRWTRNWGKTRRRAAPESTTASARSWSVSSPGTVVSRSSRHFRTTPNGRFNRSTAGSWRSSRRRTATSTSSAHRPRSGMSSPCRTPTTHTNRASWRATSGSKTAATVESTASASRRPSTSSTSTAPTTSSSAPSSVPATAGSTYGAPPSETVEPGPPTLGRLLVESADPRQRFARQRRFQKKHTSPSPRDAPFDESAVPRSSCTVLV
mmetsp:Transcript_9727/g.31687  ORF Transcript_9727/g.31687 Transcript_9727/m.31687 type:complete len:208 (-) Transcript_9727:154-777(-)